MLSSFATAATQFVRKRMKKRIQTNASLYHMLRKVLSFVIGLNGSAVLIASLSERKTSGSKRTRQSHAHSWNLRVGNTTCCRSLGGTRFRVLRPGRQYRYLLLMARKAEVGVRL